MKNNITEVVFILDASGSMYELTDDTIGGFNSMLAEQRRKDSKVLISTVTFNDSSRVVHDRVDIREVKDLTRRDYVAGGCTALIDAMGDAIHHISTVHRYIRPEDVPDNTLFIITTDGMENASHRYTSAQVKRMVEQKKEQGWEFIFMGANIDAVETAKCYGISADMAADYVSDGRGTRANFKAARKAMMMAASGCRISAEWKEDIEEDMKRRK